MSVFSKRCILLYSLFLFLPFKSKQNHTAVVTRITIYGYISINIIKNSPISSHGNTLFLNYNEVKRHAVISILTLN